MSEPVICLIEEVVKQKNYGIILSSTLSISEEEGLNSLYVTFPLHTGYRDAGIFETSQLTLDVLKSQAANKNARKFSIFYSPKIGQSRV